MQKIKNHNGLFFLLTFVFLFYAIAVSCAVWSKSCYVISNSKYGLVADSEDAAIHNGELLTSLCKKSAQIILNGTYYVNFLSSPIVEKGCEITIKGGELVFVGSRGFVLSENSSFIVNNTTLRTNRGVRCYVLSPVSATTKINKISFTNCTFYGNIITRMHFEPTRDKIGGINSLSIINCHGDSYSEDRDQVIGRFWIENGGYSQGCIIRGNVVKNMVGPFVYLSDRSPILTHLHSKVDIEGNTFKGASGVSINSYHCATLVEVYYCNFKNNRICNFINTNTGESATAYDNYLSCNKLYYENNIVFDIASKADTYGKKAYCEWGKSKSIQYSEDKSCRVFKGNHFENHAIELEKEGIVGEKDLRISIFQFSTPFDELIVENNSFVFPNGKIDFPQHSLHMRSIGKIIIERNEFRAKGFTGSLVYCSSEKRKVESIEISKNVFDSRDTPISLTSFSEKKCYGYGSILITENNSTTGFIFSGAYSDELVFKDNVSENDGKSNTPVYYNLIGCKKANIIIDKHYPTSVEKCPDIFVDVGNKCHIEYHIDNIENIPYIQFRTQDNYTLSVGYKLIGKYVVRRLDDRFYLNDNKRRAVISLDGRKIDDSISRKERLSNPMKIAKLGIDNSIITDSLTYLRTIQISGRHSTWPELNFDHDYGFDMIFN